jgi:folate-binding protein YgfZ
VTVPRKLPLHRWHEERGASLEPLWGRRVPAVYRAEPAELAALEGGAGLLDRSPFDRLEILGEDRARFLNGLVTCSLSELEPGTGSWGFLTLRKGQVLADVVIWALEDRFYLDLPPGRAKAVSEHLLQYKVADRVEVLPLGELIPLAVIGPGARQSLGDAADPLETPWSHRKVAIDGTEIHLCRHELCGEAAFLCLASASIANLFADQLVDERGIEPVGYRAWGQLRVLRGVPLWGVDYGEENLPQETGLEERGVAYDKGCYLGQEVVARLHYRGQAPRTVRALRFETGPPEPGASVLYEEREAGAISSSAPTASGGSIALAMLQRRAAEPGTAVEVEGHGAAAVVTLDDLMA